MDIQDIITQKVAEIRKATLAAGNQMTLGQLVDKIEEIGVIDREGEAKTVVYSFGNMKPTECNSYRGYYNELAIGYTEEGSWDAIKADAFLKMLKDTIGKEFTGYKGGEYTMTRDTPVWVANYSHTSDTAIVGVYDKGYQIVLLTGYCNR